MLTDSTDSLKLG